MPLVCRCRSCSHAAVCPLVIQLRFYCCRFFSFWLLYLRDAISASSLFSSSALAQVSAQTLIGEPSPVVAAHTWPLCPRAAERLGGARKPHAVVLLPCETCTRACAATLCTCSSEFTPDLAQAHASLSCPPARALEPPALAKRCTCACLVTLSTCSSEITSYLAQAHVKASCSAARSLHL